MLKTKESIISCLYKHILKLSDKNDTLAQARIKELIALSGGNKRLLKRLCNSTSYSWAEMKKLTKDLIKYYG